MSSAEVAAQIFRNAVVKGQESNTGQLLAVAQLCVGEKKYSALSSILNVTKESSFYCGTIFRANLLIFVFIVSSGQF